MNEPMVHPATPLAQGPETEPVWPTAQVVLLRAAHASYENRVHLERGSMSTTGSTFRTAEPHLHELLEDIHKGKIQLPDFQRGWVWDDDHIRALIASVSLSYPIGAVMLLE